LLLNSFAGGRPQRHPLGAVGRGEAGRNYVLTVQQAAARSAIRMAAGRGEDGRSCFLTVQQAAVRVAIRMAAGRGEDGRRSILQQPGASTRIKQIIWEACHQATQGSRHRWTHDTDTGAASTDIGNRHSTGQALCPPSPSTGTNISMY